MTTGEKAIEILQQTNDGNDLEPRDLYILQEAVNGHLSEAGIKYFNELHRKVMSGDYQKPWLCGIEHLTRDHEGYIYWKGHNVEHYTFSAMSADEVKKSTDELAAKCRHLESINVEISNRSVIWRWEQYAPVANEAAVKSAPV